MQNNPSYKEARNGAVLPFTVFCAVLLAVFVYTHSEISSRAPLQPAEEQASTKTKEPPPSPMEGKLAPDFDLPTLDGKRIKLADYHGKLLFINVWATWCAPCREEMPSMENLYKQIKGPNFEMLAISIDKDVQKAVVPFVKELGLTFPILLDPTSEVANKYKITGVPETYLVAGNGTVIHHLIGPTKWDRPEVVQAIQQMITLNGEANSGKKSAPSGKEKNGANPHAKKG